MDWTEVQKVIEKYQAQFFSLPEVVGISTGVIRNTGETHLCIKVFVSKKVVRGKLRDNKIPLELDGVPVNIVITGEMVAFDNNS